MFKLRKTTMFEKILLIVGLGVTIVGFYLIRIAYLTEQGLTWLMLLTIFSWLTVLILFIVSSLNADVKEELMRILNEQVQETKLLKEISHEQLQEIKQIKIHLAPSRKRK
ncbi:hypothetical protein JXA85_04085 [Candidatus Woesearchaeota archaeon]|nr:hypothetical protein [Candidatus Woesearchaeota archaeon]